MIPASRGDRGLLWTRRFAYADPPYPGRAWMYREHPDYGGEVDHDELIRRLCSYDGWALSTSADALPRVLALCPPGVRVAAWVRGSVASRSWTARASWEPVVYFGARPLEPSNAAVGRDDSLVLGVTPYTTLPQRVVGAKPAGFSAWLFGLLGMLPGDEFHDLFPGSGLVGRAWDEYVSRSDRGQVSSTAGNHVSPSPALVVRP